MLSQSPMYISLVLDVVTTAWYMMFLQFPSMGHVLAFQQLLCLSVSSVDLDFFMALLGLDIVALLLLMQL